MKQWDKLTGDQKFLAAVVAFIVGGFALVALGIYIYQKYPPVGVVVGVLGGLSLWFGQIGFEQHRRANPLPVKRVRPPVDQPIKPIRCDNCPAETTSNLDGGWITMQHRAPDPWLLTSNVKLFHFCPDCHRAPGTEKLSAPRTGIHLRSDPEG